MNLYKELYYQLFAAAADAVALLDAGKPREARDLLILAQRACEDRYLDAGDGESTDTADT